MWLCSLTRLADLDVIAELGCVSQSAYLLIDRALSFTCVRACVTSHCLRFFLVLKSMHLSNLPGDRRSGCAVKDIRWEELDNCSEG